MFNEVQDAVVNEVFKQVVDKIDTKSMVERLTPQITKTLEEKVLEVFDDIDVSDYIDLDDFMNDIISNSDITEILCDALTANLKKTLKVK